MDLRARFHGVQLDLLDFGLGAFGVGGALFDQFRGAGADAGVSVVDVVEEDFLGVVARCGDPEFISVRSYTKIQGKFTV